MTTPIQLRLGKSLNLSAPALSAASNDDVANWCAASTTFGAGDYGTPGAVNVDCGTPAVTDADGDGYDSIASGGDDCDDTDASIFPGAAEVVGDGIDQDCDGVDSSSGGQPMLL